MLNGLLSEAIVVVLVFLAGNPAAATDRLPAEFQKIAVIFEGLRVRDCGKVVPSSREDCVQTLHTLGYFSWGIILAVRGLDVSPRIARGDLGVLADVIKDDPSFSTESEAISAFLTKDFQPCTWRGCEKSLGVSRYEFEAIAAAFDEARSALLCLQTRDRSKDAGPIYDNTLLATVERMQQRVLAPCKSISARAEAMLRKAVRPGEGQ